MNLLVTAMDNLPSLFLHRPTFPSSQSPFLSFPIVSIPPSSQSIAPRLWRTRRFASNGVVSSAASEIYMVKNRHGVYTPKQKKVVVLWDLDNKPSRGPPYQAAMALKQVAHRFGDVIDFAAYANRHAFIHLPQWVLEQRRERKQLDILERKGLAILVIKDLLMGKECKGLKSWVLKRSLS